VLQGDTASNSSYAQCQRYLHGMKNTSIPWRCSSQPTASEEKRDLNEVELHGTSLRADLAFQTSN